MNRIESIFGSDEDPSRNIKIAVGVSIVAWVLYKRRVSRINIKEDSPRQTFPPNYLQSTHQSTNALQMNKIVFPVYNDEKSTASFWSISTLDPDKFDLNGDNINHGLHKMIVESTKISDPQSTNLNAINLDLAALHLRATDIKLIDHRFKVIKQPENRRDTFFYLRHGLTDWNKNVFLTNGPMDLPLNDQGIKEVKQAIKDMGNRRATIIVTAPSLRTIQTAEIFSRHFGLPYFVCDNLRSRDLGSWESIKSRLPEILANEDENSPDFFQRVKDKVDLVLPPEAEKLDAFKLRASSTVLKILLLQHKPIIVGHGSVFNAFTEKNQVKCDRLGLERKYGSIFEVDKRIRKDGGGTTDTLTTVQSTYDSFT